MFDLYRLIELTSFSVYLAVLFMKYRIRSIPIFLVTISLWEASGLFRDLSFLPSVPSVVLLMLGLPAYLVLRQSGLMLRFDWRLVFAYMVWEGYSRPKSVLGVDLHPLFIFTIPFFLLVAWNAVR